MKRALTQTLLATLFVAAAACAARAQSAQQKSDPPPPPRATIQIDPQVASPLDTGKLEGGSYSNDFFGFSVTLPKGWVVLGPEENKQIMDAGKGLIEEGADERKKQGVEAAAARTYFLVTASKYPKGAAKPDFNAIFLCIAERIPTAVIKTGADYFSVMQRTLEGTAAKVEVSPVRVQKVGGADFTVADIRTTIGPSVAMQRFYVRVANGHALLLTYTYFDDADLKAFDDMLGTVKFK
ncbi:MAG TPA: hypothetical protein VM936_14255 [Pyrinomonadaceae bacterium]|jgi:hypothetical protein|nr:hypothetical protein [Pyrinomonadaceae bacterium]